MYQRCPICEGLGRVERAPNSSVWAKCDVCDGKKIISSLTGLPPEKAECYKNRSHFNQELNEAWKDAVANDEFNTNLWKKLDELCEEALTTHQTNISAEKNSSDLIPNTP